MSALVAALPAAMYLLVMVPVTLMSDGTKSTAISAGLAALVMMVLLPAVDALAVNKRWLR